MAASGDGKRNEWICNFLSALVLWHFKDLTRRPACWGFLHRLRCEALNIAAITSSFLLRWMRGSDSCRRAASPCPVSAARLHSPVLVHFSTPWKSTRSDSEWVSENDFWGRMKLSSQVNVVIKNTLSVPSRTLRHPRTERPYVRWRFAALLDLTESSPRQEAERNNNQSCHGSVISCRLFW